VVKRVTEKQRLDQHDKQIAAIRNLVHEGMRLVVETRRDIAQTRKDMRTLAAAQKNTDESLKALIDTMRGGNGHGKRRVDLQ
jgi:septal ring factor EnvC (AmiA/AmiB activator)